MDFNTPRQQKDGLHAAVPHGILHQRSCNIWSNFSKLVLLWNFHIFMSTPTKLSRFFHLCSINILRHLNTYVVYSHLLSNISPSCCYGNCHSPPSSYLPSTFVAQITQTASDSYGKYHFILCLEKYGTLHLPIAYGRVSPEKLLHMQMWQAVCQGHVWGLFCNSVHLLCLIFELRKKASWREKISPDTHFPIALGKIVSWLSSTFNVVSLFSSPAERERKEGRQIFHIHLLHFL